MAMEDLERKDLLDAALKTVLATIETQWWLKAPATFVSELSGRIARLPASDQKVLGEATADEVRESLIRIRLGTEHAASAAAGTARIENQVAALQAAVEGKFEHIIDSLNQLRELAPRSSPDRYPKLHKAILVTPLRDRTRDERLRHLSVGLSEEIIRHLSRNGGFRIVSPYSVLSSEASSLDEDPEYLSIARLYGADLVVTGELDDSSRGLGRLRLRILEPKNARQVWSRDFSVGRDLGEDFSSKMLGEITQFLTGAVTEGSESRPKNDAYVFYLRSRQYFHRLRRDGYQHARTLLRQATAADPHFTLGFAKLAECCAMLYWFHEPDDAYLDEAREAAVRALELDSNSPDAHVARGIVASIEQDHGLAKQHLQQAIVIEPECFDAYFYRARLAFSEGQMQEAVEMFEHALARRPDSFQVAAQLATTLRAVGRVSAANAMERHSVEMIRRHLVLNPDDALAIALGAVSLAELGDKEEARRWMERAKSIGPNEPLVLYNMACLHSVLGEAEEGFECLRGAVQSGWSDWSSILSDPDLATVRDLPQFCEWQDSHQTRSNPK